MAKEKTIEELKAENEDLKTALKAEQDAHNATIEESEKVVKELQSKVGEKSTRRMSITHNKTKYYVNAGSFILNGQTYTAKDLKSNTELVERLVEMNSAVLSEE